MDQRACLGEQALDDYRPFADVTAGLGSLRAFLQATLPARGMSLTEDADGMLEVRDQTGALVTRFTTDRDAANTENGPDLLGLDHPLVADLLAAHRATRPENVGLAVATGDAATRGVITCWLVSARMPRGEQRVFVQPIAIREDGQRMPAWERELEAHLHSMAAPSRWTETERFAHLRDEVEPALDRELGQKGVLNGDGAYNAELIVWVELV